MDQVDKKRHILSDSAQLHLEKLYDELNESTLQERSSERIGQGIAKGHFGEYLQGYFDDIKGDIIDRACVAVPLKSHFQELTQEDETTYCDIPLGESGSFAIFIPAKNQSLIVEPADKVNSKKAAELTLCLLGKSTYGGTLRVFTGGQISRGLGTSTSDIVASVRAVADSFGMFVKNEDIARIAVDSEKASDGIMYNRATLFVTTQGRVLEDYGTYFPSVEIIGFNSDKTRRGINTLEIPSRIYSREEKKQFAVMRGAVKKAIIEKDIKLLGQVAIGSARINQRFIEKLHLEDIIDLAIQNLAAGVVVAHSGTMIGVMLDPGDMPSKSNIDAIIDGIRSFGFSDIKRYRSE